MSGLDLRTGFLILGFLYVLMPTVAWVMLRDQRSMPVVLWCGGGLLLAISSLLSGFRQGVPTWVAHDLTVFIFYCALSMRIHSLQIDLDLRSRFKAVILFALACFFVTEIINYGIEDLALRAEFNSLAWAAMLFYTARLAARIGDLEKSRSAYWIAWVYGFLAVVFVYRWYSYLGTNPATTFLIYEGFSGQLLIVAGVLSAVVGHIGYVGLALDRATQRQIRTAAEIARTDENRRLSEQIAHLDRQRSLGEMSASLGHELNQPLTAILSNAQVAKRVLTMEGHDPEKLAEFVDKIILNTRRASQIIESIRAYIRPAAAKREPVDLIQVIHEMAALVADDARARKVALHLSPPLSLLVSADPIQISQIILNIFRNAIQALDQVARREIHVELIRCNERAIVCIRDSGPGMAPETLAQAGTAFFTTKPDGLGMGLAISRGIAEQHGGTLIVDNADAGGAVVTLSLPALPAAESQR